MANTDGGAAQGGNDSHSHAERRRAAEEIKAEGERLATAVKEAAIDEVRARKDAAADYVGAVATALESGVDELRRQGRDRSAAFAGNAAESLSALAAEVANRPPAEILDEVEKFARQRPGLFFGAAFLAGFGLTRFLKSSQSAAPNPSATAAPSNHRPQHNAGGN